MASTSPPRAPRSDAERNRRRVLDAASAVFAARGPSVTLTDVAREAGVGVGTVYRNFKDREAVLDALFADKIALLVRVADDAAATTDPGEAMRQVLLGVMTARATDRGLDVILTAPSRSERFARELGDAFIPQVDELASNAAAAGELRADFAAQEVCLLGFMVGKVADVTRETDPDLWRRYAQLLIDGTRPSAARAPLSPEPLSFESMTAALGRAD